MSAKAASRNSRASTISYSNVHGSRDAHNSACDCSTAAVPRFSAPAPSTTSTSSPIVAAKRAASFACSAPRCSARAEPNVCSPGTRFETSSVVTTAFFPLARSRTRSSRVRFLAKRDAVDVYARAFAGYKNGARGKTRGYANGLSHEAPDNAGASSLFSGAARARARSVGDGRLDLAEAAAAEVLERLPDLFDAVHYERSVANHRLADRTRGEQQCLERFGPGVLERDRFTVVGEDRVVAPPQLARPRAAGAAEDVRRRGPARRDGLLDACTGPSTPKTSPASTRAVTPSAGCTTAIVSRFTSL